MYVGEFQTVDIKDEYSSNAYQSAHEITLLVGMSSLTQCLRSDGFLFPKSSLGIHFHNVRDSK